MRNGIKGFVIAFVMICMAGVVMPEMTAKAAVEGNYEYEELSDGTVKIAKYTGSETDVTIPSTLGGKQVTVIGDNAFMECANITHVVIPSGVTSIGEGTSMNRVYSAFFRCTSLKYVDMPNSVTDITRYAFYGCSALESVNIPDSVTNIQWGAFEGCSSLTSIEIPSSVTSFSKGVFGNCESLQSITVDNNNPIYYSDGNCVIERGSKELIQGCNTTVIPENVTGIGWNSFYGCKQLEDIIIPNNVNKIEPQAFMDCVSLKSIKIPNGVTSIRESTFSGCSNLKSIEIPNGVTIIGESAFSDCSNLKNIEIPSSVTTIGYSAFSNCSGLTSVDIPGSVTVIKNRTFYGCNGLKSVTISNGVTGIGNDEDHHLNIGVFEGCSSLTSITIPYDVSYIGEEAFIGCPDNMTVCVEQESYAEKWAQENDYALEVDLSSEKCKVRTLSNDTSNPTVTYIGTTDESAITIKVPDAVTINGVVYKVVGIADHAFSGNKNITKVNIGKNVASIGEKAFSDCPSLEEVVLPEALETVSPDVFEGTAEADSEKELKITVSEGTEDVSKAGIENITNIQYVTIYVPEGSKTEIYLKQFDYLVIITYPPTQSSNENKENEEIPKTTEQVTEAPKEQPEIGKKYTVNNLTYKVTSSKYVTFVGTSKKSLKTLTIPAKVTILGQSLEVTAIEKRAMKKCSKLTTVVIGSNVKTIGDEAFMNCSHLKKITIGKNVKTIGKKAFYGDKNVTRITFKGAKLSKVGKKALSKIPKKVKIKAPKKVEKKYEKILNRAR